jgi:RimJ/RimL family protein N-acetyltransferase
MAITTSRLLIASLSENDADFILQLLNSKGWIKYIGNRDIYSQSDAMAYIRKINENPDITYWTVKLKDDYVTIGLVTLIKREHLEFSDIGFAFLPGFFGKGYAYEATKAILLDLKTNRVLDHILAITMPENLASIKLIGKLGLKYEKTIKQGEDMLNLYYMNVTIDDSNPVADSSPAITR